MNDTIRNNIRLLSSVLGEKIKRLCIYVEKDYIVEVKDFPFSEFEKLLEIFLQFDTIHKSFLEEDGSQEIFMKKYYLDNPSYFHANGQPKW